MTDRHKTGRLDFNADFGSTFWTVSPGAFGATCDHYRDVVGFDREFRAGDDARGHLAMFAYGPTQLFIGTPGAWNLASAAPTEHALLVIRVPHAAQLRDIIARRGESTVSAMKPNPWAFRSAEELDAGDADTNAARAGEGGATATFFDVTDPARNVIRFLSAPVAAPTTP